MKMIKTNFTLGMLLLSHQALAQTPPPGGDMTAAVLNSHCESLAQDIRVELGFSIAKARALKNLNKLVSPEADIVSRVKLFQDNYQLCLRAEDDVAIAQLSPTGASSTQIKTLESQRALLTENLARARNILSKEEKAISGFANLLQDSFTTLQAKIKNTHSHMMSVQSVRNALNDLLNAHLQNLSSCIEQELSTVSDRSCQGQILSEHLTGVSKIAKKLDGLVPVLNTQLTRLSDLQQKFAQASNSLLQLGQMQQQLTGQLNNVNYQLNWAFGAKDYYWNTAWAYYHLAGYYAWYRNWSAMNWALAVFRWNYDQYVFLMNGPIPQLFSVQASLQNQLRSVGTMMTDLQNRMPSLLMMTEATKFSIISAQEVN